MEEKITLKDFIKITKYGYKIDISKYINKKISYQLNMKNIFNMIDDGIKGSLIIYTSRKNITHLKKIFKSVYRLRKNVSYIGSVNSMDIFIKGMDFIKDNEILLFNSNNIDCNDDFSAYQKQIQRQQKLDFIETL